MKKYKPTGRAEFYALPGGRALLAVFVDGIERPMVERVHESMASAKLDADSLVRWAEQKFGCINKNATETSGKCRLSNQERVEVKEPNNSTYSDGLQMLNLDWPPTVNTYWRRSGNKIHISKRGRDYRNHVARAIIQQNLQQVKGYLKLNIIARPPDNRRRDIDNILKALLDSLEHGGAFEDDYQVKKINIERTDPCKPNGLLIVYLWPWECLGNYDK